MTVELTDYGLCSPQSQSVYSDANDSGQNVTYA